MAQQGPLDDEQGEAGEEASVDPSAPSPPPAEPASAPSVDVSPKGGAKGGLQRAIKPTPPRNELTLAQVKRLARVFHETKQNVTRTAKITKISRTTIYRYLREGDSPRGIPPLLSSTPGSIEAPSGELPDDDESAPVDATPPPTTTTPAASTGAPSAVPETAPAVTMPSAAQSTPPLVAPKPVVPAVGGGKVQTLAEADREMLAVARMTRQLLGAKIATVAKLARELEQGVPDPANPKGVRQKRRLSQDDRELLALFGAARTTPESVIRLYEIEAGILRRMETENEAVGSHDETADALRQELVDLLGPTANTPEDS